MYGFYLRRMHIPLYIPINTSKQPINTVFAADWTKSHNHHHRHLGRFDISDFSLTVWFSEKEYQAMSLPLRCAYVEEHLYNIQCMARKICTLRNEKFHLAES